MVNVWPNQLDEHNPVQSFRIKSVPDFVFQRVLHCKNPRSHRAYDHSQSGQSSKINVKKIAFGNKEHTTDQKMGVSVLMRLFISSK